MNHDESIRAYSAARPSFERYAKRVKSLLDDFLRQNKIKASTDCRAKAIDSFAEKLRRPGKQYVNPIAEMTDLAAARVVCPDNATVDLVCEGLKGFFEIDQANSVDKRKAIDADRFGYSSIHLIVKPGGRRGLLPEWEEYREFRAEIQIKTILAHAWALVSHSESYKRETEVPLPLLRRLARLAALLELADEEISTVLRFNQVMKARTQRRIADFDYTMAPDIVSLGAYLCHAAVVRQILGITGHLERVDSLQGLTQLLHMVNGLGFATLGMLDDQLRAIIEGEGCLRSLFSDDRIRNYTLDRAQLVLFALLQRFVDELDPHWLCTRLNWDPEFLDSVFAAIEETRRNGGV